MKTIDRFTFRMPIESKKEIKRTAKIKGYPMNVVLLQWTWKGIEEFYKERGK